jgi:hypothetical protein
MAEVKNAFIKSKMNKDLDARLLPNGEYRNAINAQISRSEGADVGALENVLGNFSIATFEEGESHADNLTCIGHIIDETSNYIYLFLTDNNTSDYIPNGNGSNHFIYRFDVTNGTSIKLVSGPFLNFSKNFPIYGINLLENLLFWTDNRNQPRKINVLTASTAENANSYYQTEDQISVATYNPWDPIKLYQEIDADRVADNELLQPAQGEHDTTMRDVVSKFYPGGGTAKVDTGTTGTTIDIIDINIPFFPNKASANKIPQAGMTVGVINVSSGGNGPITDTGFLVDSSTANAVTLTGSVTVQTGDILVFNFNPYYDNSYAGDSRFLEDKFIRFSYRFKFDDGEYSIYAPFTQPCFIPKQDGYFLNTEENLGDQQSTFASTVVEFMENKVNEITLCIPLPSAANTLRSDFLVKEIDILFKESDGLSVQVVETIPINVIESAAGTDTTYEYKYINKKPFKTLPESELIRVYDKVPVKALSQEVTSNRVVYGNFQNKHTPPSSLDYYVSVGEKANFDVTDTNPILHTTGLIEYPNSSVKANRTYQVGVILSDKFGRQSSVILSNNKQVITVNNESYSGDTVYAPYPDLENISGAFHEWPGNSLKMSFNSVIGPSEKNETTLWPGLYNGDPSDPAYNPLGWYSYKIVVKQNEQEYYNVYTAGAMKGLPYNYDTDSVTPVLNEDTSFVTLLNDNINKVPRDLTEVGPQDKTFRSSVKLFGRVENTANTFSNTGNKQYEPERVSFTTNNIEDLYDLFDVLDFENNVNAKVPITSDLNPFHPFYKSDSNPFVAEFVTSQTSDFQFGVNNQSTTTNVGTAEVNEPSGSNPGSTVINIDTLTAGFSPSSGELVTGTNIEPNTFVVSYDGTSGALTLSKSQPGIADNTVLTFSDVTYYDIENLAIFETAPTVSRLDIYWETTSAGLISDLNEAIGNSDTSVEATLTDFNDSQFFENLGALQNILTQEFEVVDNFGVEIDKDLVSLTTVSIVDFNNNDASNLLEVYEPDPNNQPKEWNIRTKQSEPGKTNGFVDNVYFGTEENLRKFKFTFDISVENSGTADVNGSVTNSTSVVIDNISSGFTPVVGATVAATNITQTVLVESYDSGTSTLVLNSAVTLNNNDQITITNSPPSISRVSRIVSLQNVAPLMYDNYAATGTPLSGTVDLGVIPLLSGTVLTPLAGKNGGNDPNSGKDLSWKIKTITNSEDNVEYATDYRLASQPSQSDNTKNARSFELVNTTPITGQGTFTATIELNDPIASSVVDFNFSYGTVPYNIWTNLYGTPGSYGGIMNSTQVVIIEINDQPAGSNGYYFYRGSINSLKTQSALNQVIFIDRLNARTFTPANPPDQPNDLCSTTDSQFWAFGETQTSASRAFTRCLFPGSTYRSQPEQIVKDGVIVDQSTYPFFGFSFSVKTT